MCPSCGSQTREDERLCSSCGWDFVARKRVDAPDAAPPAPKGFSLPALKPLDEKAPAVKPKPKAEPPPARPEAARKKTKRILIIEDEPGYQELLESILIAIPFEVTICGSVEEAEVKIDAELFDLIITDINLQGMTGFEVLDKMKALKRLEACPVVMCSSQFDPETKARAASMGAAGFIPKPYQFEMVIAMVKALLGVQF